MCKIMVYSVRSPALQTRASQYLAPKQRKCMSIHTPGCPKCIGAIMNGVWSMHGVRSECGLCIYSILQCQFQLAARPVGLLTKNACHGVGCCNYHKVSVLRRQREKRSTYLQEIYVGNCSCSLNNTTNKARIVKYDSLKICIVRKLIAANRKKIT